MSMYINFRLRDPANTRLAEGRFDYVPRVGESVSLDDLTRDVHSVDYNLTTNSITVVLKD